MARALWLSTLLACGGQVDIPCPTSEIACNAICVDTTADNANCGSCGNECASSEVCVRGACTALMCGSFAMCPHTCTSFDVDPRNCGACGVRCNGYDGCVDGACTTSVCKGGDEPCVSAGECCSLDCNGLFCGCIPSTASALCTRSLDCCSGSCDLVTGQCQ